MAKQKEKEYAAYHGETLLHTGTKKELAGILNVSVNTVAFYASPAYLRRAEAGNIDKRIIVVSLEDEE